MPERGEEPKTLLWTKLGQKREQFGLVGSKFGLSGLSKRFFVGNFLR